MINGVAPDKIYYHGETVSYECLPDFEEVISGNITCDYGEWKGVPPVCEASKILVVTLWYYC